MTREERVINKIGDDYKCKVIKEDGPNTRISITHKKCGLETERQYAGTIRYGYVCECIKNEEKRKNMQQKIDEHYGQGKFILEKLGKVKENNSTIRVSRCNHILKDVKLSTFLKNKSTYDCPICNKSASNRLTIEEINKRVYDQFKNKITYVSGYETISSRCIFKFKDCGHEYDYIFSDLFNRKTFSNLECPICNDKEEKRKQEIEKSLLPIYKVGEKINKCGDYKINCSVCGQEQPTRSISTVKTSLTNRCDCERTIQKEIIDSILDIDFQGKTDRKSKYLDVDTIIDFQTKKKINYKISKSLYTELDDIYNKYIKTLREVNDIELPYSKIEIDLSNNETISVKAKETNYFITKIVALKLNYFDINTIIYIEYKNSKSEYSTCFYTRKNKPITFVRYEDEKGIGKITKLRYECNQIGNLAINIIHYLTNLYNIEKEERISDGQIRHKETLNDYISEVGVTEYKTLVRDTKTKYVNIRTNNMKKRKIRASFDVAGHYMHFKNGNKTFRDTFEKGKQYRHIRRIEKNYIIK